MRQQRIIISSVMHDCEDRRKAAERAIRALGMAPMLAEPINASSGSPEKSNCPPATIPGSTFSGRPLSLRNEILAERKHL